MKNNKGFTLVELIVVITILAILATIAFISIQNLTKDSRNTVRVSDLSLINKSMSLIGVSRGFYPEPDNNYSITYSGGLLWKQGIFGDNSFRQLGELSEKPIDPLFEKEYQYSILGNKTKFTLAAAIEGSLAFESDYSFTNKANAASSSDFVSYVVGDYNYTDIKAMTGSDCYMLSVPNIMISNQLSGSDILNGSSYNFLYNDSKNLALSYSGSIDYVDQGQDFQIAEVLSTCEITSLGQLSIYIQSLSNTYQQYSNQVNYNSLVFHSDTKQFMKQTIGLLKEKGISVSSDVEESFEKNVFFNDSFTGSNNTSLALHSNADGSWSGSTSNYEIFGDALRKTITGNHKIYPDPIIPTNSIDTNTLFKINDFGGANINIYARYTDIDNYYKVELRSDGYRIISRVSSSDSELVNVSDTIAVGDFVELVLKNDNIKLYIGGKLKENIVDSSISSIGIQSVELEQLGSEIDSYSLIYN